MRYAEALNFLYSKLPMFTRVGAPAYKSGLGNIVALCAALGNPEKKIRSIHVAGTNGKGSTSHFLASILQEAGYKTGLFTSPHLKDFRERIRINGSMIPARRIARFVEQNQALLNELEPSFFEMNVALAFSYFADEQVDVAVIETGLGGRLDSTNLIQPDLSIITNISLDHADLLGNTLKLIAGEKAGIIKHNVPVIISEKQIDIQSVFENKATETGSCIRFASDEIQWHTIEWTNDNPPFLHLEGNFNGKKWSVHSPISGTYQSKNIAGVLLATDELQKRGYSLNNQNILEGIKKVTLNTGLKGRWEKLSDSPTIYCDTGHNEAGVAEVLQMISRISFDRLHLVWGMVGDKDVEKILEMLPKDAHFYFCKANIPRAMDVNQLQKLAATKSLNGVAFTSVKRAVANARKNASPNDLIVVGGSTFVVAEV
jgi:dihydrofolate synthase/folylpolyglutamate synthase